MTQEGLFDGTPSPGSGTVQVRFPAAFAPWQVRARTLIQRGTAPEQVLWLPGSDLPGKADEPPAANVADGAIGADGADVVAPPGGDDHAPVANIRVPRIFLEQARVASCHRAPDRWSLLYQVLWRLAHGEPHVMQLHGDPQVIRLNAYAKAVQRDIHKMKAFVRFRAMNDPEAGGAAEPRYVAWFEPSHHIVEAGSAFFRRRFANMRWSILTPERCAHWEGEGEVWFSEGARRSAAPGEDVLEDAWRTYYRSIFNPARLKVRAMLSEMPQKYWKNLPEARLIPLLVRDANQRTAGMQERRKQVDEPRCGPRPLSPRQVHQGRMAEAGAGTLQQLRLEAGGCRRCPLWEPATQAVWGEGPADARIMLVGEQPGDREDLTGRPFVGPAGQLLDRALSEAGLARDSLYLTNTVKHFKFRIRGKRRIHDKPSDAEALACLSWLQAEIAKIRPVLIVCMGATAARAQLRRPVRINLERGRILLENGPDTRAGSGSATGAGSGTGEGSGPATGAGTGGGPALLLTFHPSYLLRLEPGPAAEAFDKLVADLRLAGQWSASPSGATVAAAEIEVSGAAGAGTRCSGEPPSGHCPPVHAALPR